MHGEAKESAEIDSEKEIVDISVVQTMGKDKFGSITQSGLQEALDKNAGEEKAKATLNGENFVIQFIESNRYYEVDGNGEITGPIEVVVDKNPGDITVGINGEELKGTEGSPYEIWCIEDLVAFSENINTSATYGYSVIKLCTTLDFNSTLSYADYTTTKYDTYLGGDGTTELMTQLSQEGKGFIPIGDARGANNYFRGSFNGQGYAIENIFIKDSNKTIGLFGSSLVQDQKMSIKNLNISGKMIGDIVGGICGDITLSTSTSDIDIQIENCISNVEIEGNITGGIIGRIGSGSGKGIIIANCINKGKITGKNTVGGILGYHHNNQAKMINCFNTGNLSGDIDVGGILGYTFKSVDIINSYNLGNIKSNENAGWIIGKLEWSEQTIGNCYNIGDVLGKVAGGIIGALNTSNDMLETKNCYYINKISKGIGGWDYSKESAEDVKGISITEIKSSEILEKLNDYVVKNETKEGIVLKKWIIGTQGFPVYE